MSKTTRIFKLIFIFVLMLSAYGLAPTRTARAAGLWFVSGWAGSDAKACNTAVAPCRTINAAIAKALPGDTIYITGDPYTNSGAPEVVRVTKNLTLSGGWNSTFGQQIGYTILNGQHQRRGLLVPAGVTVQVSHLAIVWGFALDGAGAYIEGTFYGNHMIVAQNRAFRGAGFFLDNPAGRLNLSTSSVYANEYYDRGGGIFINDGISYTGNVTISSNISINSVDEEHGTPSNSGGGVYLYRGYFWSSNATFAENTRFDGHIFTQDGAGLANELNYGTIQIANVLIADGCTGYIQTVGNNLERGNTCQLGAAGDIANTNPQIYQADVNGDDTITHALAPASPAIDVASPVYCGSPSHDQRGVPRPQGSGCDIGAFERKADDPQQGVIGGCPPDPTGAPLGEACPKDPTRLLRSLLVPGALQSAQDGVSVLVASGEIAPQMSPSLVSQLAAAAQSVADGQFGTAVDQLAVFMRQVEVQRGRNISEGVADSMLGQTQAIIDILTAGPATDPVTDPAGGLRAP